MAESPDFSPTQTLSALRFEPVREPIHRDPSPAGQRVRHPIGLERGNPDDDVAREGMGRELQVNGAIRGVDFPSRRGAEQR
jgi:hypothetical protein